MRTLLAAIAKDEALYLPEWVYHYFSIGIDEAWIYINNTRDKSRDILDSIINAGFNIKIIEADRLAISRSATGEEHISSAFEERNPIQSRAFAEIYALARKARFDYVAFFDVDEFLQTRGHSIQNLISHSNNADLLRFNWFCQYFDNRPFDTAFQPCLRGERKMLPKNIVSTRDDMLRFLSTHDVVFSTYRFSAWFPDAGKVPGDTSFRDIPWGESYYLIHRVFRSREEFLALIGNGDNIAIGEVDGFKLNRFSGWAPKPVHEIKLDPDQVATYRAGYLDFLRHCKLEDLLEIEKKRLHQKSVALRQKILTLQDRTERLLRGLERFGLILWLCFAMTKLTILRMQV